MVTAGVSLIVIAAALGQGGAGPDPAVTDDSAVRSALERGAYPWYDARTDSAKPVWPPGMEFAEWLERLADRLKGWRLPSLGNLSIGDLLIVGIAMLALSIFVVFLIEAWRRYRPTPRDTMAASASVGSNAPLEGLPAGIRPTTDDPWTEAADRAARGDYAGAVVCLFAYQLLVLDRMRLIRLSPGKTARQLVRTIEDRDYRDCVDPTRRAFEAVYYGHQVPTPEAFAAVWQHAEAFKRRAAAGAAL